MIKYIKFAELPVADQNRALSFYTEKLGLRVMQDASYQGDWRWIELEIPGADTRLLFTKPENGGAVDSPRLVLIVDDVKATFQDLSDKGVLFTKEPARAPWNPGETFAQFRDSEGNGIVISASQKD